MDDQPAQTSATPPDLGPEFNGAREHLRATVLTLIDDGMYDGDPLKCMATAATALLGAATIERDALAAEVKRLNAGISGITGLSGYETNVEICDAVSKARRMLSTECPGG